MALGGPINKDIRNKVIVHMIGNDRYTSMKVYTVDADGKKHYTYKHWGTPVDGNRFQPGPIISALLSQSATNLSILQHGTRVRCPSC